MKESQTLLYYIVVFSTISYSFQKSIDCSRIISNTCFIENLNLKSINTDIWEIQTTYQIQITNSIFSCSLLIGNCSLSINSPSLKMSGSLLEAHFINLTIPHIEIVDSTILTNATVKNYSSQTNQDESGIK